MIEREAKFEKRNGKHVEIWDFIKYMCRVLGLDYGEDSDRWKVRELISGLCLETGAYYMYHGHIYRV